MIGKYMLLAILLGSVAWAASCSSTQVIEIESLLSPDGQYRATLVARSRNTARGFVVLLGRSAEQPEPRGIFQVVVPFESDLDQLAEERVVNVRWESSAVLVVSYEQWLKPHRKRDRWEAVSIRYEERPGVRR